VSARVIKVQHSLDSTRLETIYEGPCGSIKGSVGWTSRRTMGIKMDEMRKMKVDIDAVQTDQEINKGLLFFCGYMGKEGRCDGFS
jgi:hypothetical protein